jgi:membrane-bound serine protease (ClpP class)
MKPAIQHAFYLLLLSLLFALPASADVLKIVVHDTINPITAEYIGRTIDQAKAEHDDAVLIELHTPGGMLDSTREIIEKILASPVPVIVFVTPSGGYAASAGFFILQSADVAAMSPGTNIGAAHPVLANGLKVDDVMKAKMENDAAALIRSYVSKRGHNVEVAESAVRESKSFSAQEALDKNLIDVIANDDNDLLTKLDGRTITRFGGEKTTLHLSHEVIRSADMTVKQKVLGFLMDPNMAFIFFSLGMMALYAEFNHPGAVIPGVIGIICISLAVVAFNLLPTSLAAVFLILGAFALFGLEVKFQTHGALGLGGIVLMIIGALLLVDGPIPEMRVKLITALSVTIPIGLITIFLVTVAYKAHRNKVITGVEGMLGLVGVAQTAMPPMGKVFVHGETWNANSANLISPGELVVVRKVNGLELEVEKAGVIPAANAPRNS